MSDPTLGEVFRIGIEAKTEIAELQKSLNTDRADRVTERHSFREEMHRLLQAIQGTQVDQVALVSKLEERLTGFGGLQQVMLSQAQTIGELRESLRGVLENRTAILSQAEKIGNMTARLEIVSNMSGKGLSIVMVALTGLGGSVIGGILIYMLTQAMRGGFKS